MYSSILWCRPAIVTGGTAPPHALGTVLGALKPIAHAVSSDRSAGSNRAIRISRNTRSASACASGSAVASPAIAANAPGDSLPSK